MDILQIVGIGLLTTILILVIREQKPMFAFLLAAFFGVAVFLALIGKIEGVVTVLEELADRSGIQTVYLKTMLKIIGIAYIAEFGAQIVRDAGMESVASKIEFAGKMLILVMAVPIISVIIETVLGLLPA
ncbi:stage III sporulation protein AD [Cohnella nanjingensis]|uniref:Stage III sporulation protein AD n=1 Tax=Cohnella nanjingensis TaxID=1387779 RepID=A0A7X0RX19_9BACL|nr:stage III sporulation protein AD [Cohnella nanjingensis]MBB6675243.1 stage III sporulation protein AD [Cohnella nanjingensis]